MKRGLANQTAQKYIYLQTPKAKREKASDVNEKQDSPQANRDELKEGEYRKEKQQAK